VQLCGREVESLLLVGRQLARPPRDTSVQSSAPTLYVFDIEVNQTASDPAA